MYHPKFSRPDFSYKVATTTLSSNQATTIAPPWMPRRPSSDRKGSLPCSMGTRPPYGATSPSRQFNSPVTSKSKNGQSSGLEAAILDWAWRCLRPAPQEEWPESSLAHWTSSRRGFRLRSTRSRRRHLWLQHARRTCKSSLHSSPVPLSRGVL